MISSTILSIQNDDLRYTFEEGRFFLYDLKENRLLTHPMTCRDELRMDWEGTNTSGEKDGSVDYSSHRTLGFTVGSTTLNVETFDRRLRQIERMVGLGPRRMTVIYRVGNHPGTIILRLGAFWTQHQVHRSLITLIVRMIAAYWHTSLDQAIDDYKHASAVKPALMWFLKGHTKATFRRFNDEWKRWNRKMERAERDYNDSLIGRLSDIEPPGLSDEFDGQEGFVGEFANASPADLRRKLVRP